MDKYIFYLKNAYSELNLLPKLSIKDILKYKEPYKMFLLFYYGYSSMYKIYKLEELNRCINNNGNNVYLIANYKGNIKLMKKLEKKGINIYSKNVGGNNFLNKNYLWPNYYKIAPYVIKNMNYKLNKYRMCFI